MLNNIGVDFSFFLYRAKDELPPSSHLLFPHDALILFFSPPLPFKVGPINTARVSWEAPLVVFGANRQPTDDLVHIGVKTCSSGGSSFC